MEPDYTDYSQEESTNTNDSSFFDYSNLFDFIGVVDVNTFGALNFHYALPGVKKENLKVTIEDGNLRIRCEFYNVLKDNEMCTWEHSLEIGSLVDSGHLGRGVLWNGILTVTLKKCSKEGVKVIDVVTLHD